MSDVDSTSSTSSPVSSRSVSSGSWERKLKQIADSSVAKTTEQE